MLKDNYLFEISWEVCNKIGGIHTVINSKVSETKKHFNNYFCMGPYVGENNSEFEPKQIPEQFKNAKENLELKGIKLHYGNWKTFNTYVILVEHLGYSNNINNIKSQLWEKYQIDSLNSNWYDFDEAILWSWTCGIVIEELTKDVEQKVLVHSHEWMSGGAIFYLNDKSKYKTIFTTHATMLGRALTGSGIDVHKLSNSFNAEQKAYEINVHTKFQTEKALAKTSDCFTTVSNITAEEASKFYKIKPEVLLYNGFNSNIFENYEKSQLKFKENREMVNTFLKSYFNDFYDIDTQKCELMYTSGRNEFRSKGVGYFIETLAKLNNDLIETKSEKEIVTFFLIPIGEFENDELVTRSINNYKNNIKPKLNYNYIPLSTHKVPIDNDIIKAFLKNNLLNKKEDKVKVILMPFYLSENDNIFNKDYYDVTSGFDLSVFPSYYEPWGYTPMESITLGVPTITTNLAGFGRYNQEKYSNNKHGVEVIDRINNDSPDKMVKVIKNQLNLTEQDKNIIKESTFKFAKNFDWEKFYQNYINAYNIALNK